MILALYILGGIIAAGVLAVVLLFGAMLVEALVTYFRSPT